MLKTFSYVETIPHHYFLIKIITYVLLNSIIAMLCVWVDFLSNIYQLLVFHLRLPLSYI